MAKEIKAEEEWKRISHILLKLKRLRKFISLDTRKSLVMEKGIKNKINLINKLNDLRKCKNNSLVIANWSLSEFPLSFRNKFFPIIKKSYKQLGFSLNSSP